jgi:hypothetical protein
MLSALWHTPIFSDWCSLTGDRLAYGNATSSGNPKRKGNEPKKISSYGRLLLGLIADDVDSTKCLFDPFEMKVAIQDLFVEDAPEFVFKGPMSRLEKALFVCAAWDETDQIILEECMPVVNALTAARLVLASLAVNPSGAAEKWLKSSWIGI